MTQRRIQAGRNAALVEETFRSDRFQDITLAHWLALTPHELVRAHRRIDESVLAKVPPYKTPVVPA